MPLYFSSILVVGPISIVWLLQWKSHHTQTCITLVIVISDTVTGFQHIIFKVILRNNINLNRSLEL